MAYLVNRNPCGRIICLHALCGYLANRFSTGRFVLNDIKFDAKCSHNIHQTCQLLVQVPGVRFPVCPYLDNLVSQAKCYLTQSIQEDTQKSKSASDAFNALEGLGLIDRAGSQGYLTSEGVEFARCDYASADAYKHIRRAVTRYGPFWGLLFLADKCKDSGNTVTRTSITVGYPETREVVTRHGRSLLLSTGSQPDTIVRTRSVLFAWGTTAGFLAPLDLQRPHHAASWHMKVLPYIRSKKWTTHKYQVLTDKRILESKPYVARPLGYEAMTKSTKALRERNQAEQRGVTLEFEKVIKNRRFGVCYLLGVAAEQNCGVDFDKMVAAMEAHSPLFVLEKRDFAEVMGADINIAFAAGIPFSVENRSLHPLTRLNRDALAAGAPGDVTQALQRMSASVMVTSHE